MDNGTHCVQRIPGGQIEPRRDFGSSSGLFMALPFHLLMAAEPQLNASRRVNSVVDAAVEGEKTAQQRAVGRVDNGVALQRRNISLPQGQLGPGGYNRQVGGLHDPDSLSFFLQILILHFQKLLVRRLGRTHVHQRPKQIPLSVFSRRNRGVPIPRLLFQQPLNQITAPCLLRHALFSLFLNSQAKKKPAVISR